MTAAYIALLALVGAGRLLELRISRRHQHELAARGVQKIAEPHFRWMVLLHGGVLAGAAVEVLWLHRPWMPPLAATMGVLFAFANALRWWVMRSLAGHWNVEVTPSAPLGVVTSGPYRWVRHPNYVAVVVELFSLPMIHTAWITASVAALANAEILRRRLRVEETALASDSNYRALMGAKPRFLPKMF